MRSLSDKRVVSMILVVSFSSWPLAVFAAATADLVSAWQASIGGLAAGTAASVTSSEGAAAAAGAVVVGVDAADGGGGVLRFEK